MLSKAALQERLQSWSELVADVQALNIDVAPFETPTIVAFEATVVESLIGLSLSNLQKASEQRDIAIQFKIIASNESWKAKITVDRAGGMNTEQSYSTPYDLSSQLLELCLTADCKGSQLIDVDISSSSLPVCRFVLVLEGGDDTGPGRHYLASSSHLVILPADHPHAALMQQVYDKSLARTVLLPGLDRQQTGGLPSGGLTAILPALDDFLYEHYVKEVWRQSEGWHRQLLLRSSASGPGPSPGLDQPGLTRSTASSSSSSTPQKQLLKLMHRFNTVWHDVGQSDYTRDVLAQQEPGLRLHYLLRTCLEAELLPALQRCRPADLDDPAFSRRLACAAYTLHKGRELPMVGAAFSSTRLLLMHGLYDELFLRCPALARYGCLTRLRAVYRQAAQTLCRKVFEGYPRLYREVLAELDGLLYGQGHNTSSSTPSTSSGCPLQDELHRRLDDLFRIDVLLGFGSGGNKAATSSSTSSSLATTSAGRQLVTDIEELRCQRFEETLSQTLQLLGRQQTGVDQGVVGEEEKEEDLRRRKEEVKQGLLELLGPAYLQDHVILSYGGDQTATSTFTSASTSSSSTSSSASSSSLALEEIRSLLSTFWAAAMQRLGLELQSLVEIVFIQQLGEQLEARLQQKMQTWLLAALALGEGEGQLPVVTLQQIMRPGKLCIEASSQGGGEGGEGEEKAAAGPKEGGGERGKVEQVLARLEDILISQQQQQLK